MGHEDMAQERVKRSKLAQAVKLLMYSGSGRFSYRRVTDHPGLRVFLALLSHCRQASGLFLFIPCLAPTGA
jgi:hypothetical protein